MLLWHRGNDEIGSLIARRKYDRAEKILRRLLTKEPESVHLRQRLADLLILKGDSIEGLKVLDRLAMEFDRQGFLDKSLAVIKKMRRILPDHGGLARRAMELEARREGLVWEQLRSHAPAPVESARALGFGGSVKSHA